MTEGQRFGKFALKTDNDGDRLLVEYLPTGETDVLDATGGSLKRVVEGEIELSTADGTATLSVGSDGILEVTDSGGTRDL